MLELAQRIGGDARGKIVVKPSDVRIIPNSGYRYASYLLVLEAHFRLLNVVNLVIHFKDEWLRGLVEA